MEPQFPGIAQDFTRYRGAHFFQTYPRVIKPLKNITLLLVVTKYEPTINFSIFFQQFCVVCVIFMNEEFGVIVRF